MKAIRYYGPGKTLKVEEIEISKIGDNEVLVKVKAAGICHTDLHFLDGTLTPWKGELPITLGHEIAGEISGVGKNVNKFREGDRVILNNNVSCGKCHYCKTGHENLCLDLDQHGFTIDGGYAEFVKTVERTLVKLPADVSYETGSVLPCATASVYHGLVDVAELRSGEVLMINGFGGLGTNALQVAKYLGAKTFVTDISEEKLKLAKKLGADAVVNAATSNVGEEIKELTDGRGADVVLELVGTKKAMENALNSLGRTGRYVIIGYTKDKLELSPLNLVVGEFKVLGSVSYTHRDLEDVINLAHERKIDPYISQTFRLEEVPHALELLREGKISGRAVAKP